MISCGQALYLPRTLRNIITNMATTWFDPYRNMKYEPDRHPRRSIRMKGYDYSETGAYFVTICTKDWECLLGDIVDVEMRLNDAGEVVSDIWHKIAEHFPCAEIDAFVVMPNHVHGIVVICHDNCRGEVSSPINVSSMPKTKQGGDIPPLRRTLGQIIGYFKYQSSKQINQIRNTPGHPVWQRRMWTFCEPV